MTAHLLLRASERAAWMALLVACVACESGEVRGEGAASKAPAAAPPGAGSVAASPAAPVPAASPSAPAPAAHPGKEGVGAASAAAPPAAAAGKANATATSYGAAFVRGPEVALSALLSNPAKYENQTVITEGNVQRACTRKGCWMEIGQGDDACRVTFKDYGFFVPKDSAGARARIQGRLDTRVVAAGDVAHLESEGARFKSKKPDGTATEVRMIATAVQLLR